MKNIQLIGTTILCCLGLTSKIAYCETLFKDKDFQNAISTTSYTVDGIGVRHMDSSANDRASSIVMGQIGQCAALFSDDNYRGSVLITAGSTNLATDNFNDITSSFFTFYGDPNALNQLDACKKSSEISWMYEHIDRNSAPKYADGYAYPVKMGALITDLGWFNDRASSVNVSAAHCMKLWVNSPPKDTNSYNNWYLNPTLVITSLDGIVNLPANINDAVSAVEIRPYNPISHTCQ